MKILISTPYPLNSHNGPAKVVLELFDALTRQGAQVTLLGGDDLVPEWEQRDSFQRRFLYHEALKNFIKENAHHYDVIDYDHEYLPFNRNIFPKTPLMVARSLLLVQHLNKINFPRSKQLRFFIDNFWCRANTKKEIKKRIQISNQTILNADLINVANHQDRDELIKLGIPKNKILVLPYAIGPSHQPLFQNLSRRPSKERSLVFIGAFEYRKGATHFAPILEKIHDEHPDLTLKLIGCSGMFTKKEQILRFFPKHLADSVDITLQCPPEDLPKIIDGAWAGIYPSYVEGFPFGVLEMLSASIPVAAFNAPGASMMLPDRWLASPGSNKELINILLPFLASRESNIKFRKEAIRRSHYFCWDEIAQQTLNAYERALGVKNVA